MPNMGPQANHLKTKQMQPKLKQQLRMQLNHKQINHKQINHKLNMHMHSAIHKQSQPLQQYKPRPKANTKLMISLDMLWHISSVV